MTQPTRAEDSAAKVIAIHGVAGVTIIDDSCQPASSAGASDARRDAVLTAFLATRVRAMTAEGDLRGIGRQLRESLLLHASCSGRNREFLIIPNGDVTAFASLKPGAFADIVLEDTLTALNQR